MIDGRFFENGEKLSRDRNCADKLGRNSRFPADPLNVISRNTKMIAQANFNDPEETKSFIQEAFDSQPARLRHLEVIAELVRDCAHEI